MVEKTHEVHQKFTYRERKQFTLQRVDEVAKWTAELRKQAKAGQISWEKFDSLIARAIVARERLVDRERERSLIDKLTGIPNRRWLDFELNREMEEAKRLEKPLGILMLDADHLKEINDKCGHQIGDQALKAVAQTIQNNTRDGDFCAKYGGEEFTVIAKEPNRSTLKKIAERLRQTVEEISLSDLPKITVSVGGTLYKTGEPLEVFIKRADDALYISKKEGRNKVTIA